MGNSEGCEKKLYVEQVWMVEGLACAVFEEARRRDVSRAQVIREALNHHLGFRDEGVAEPARRDTRTGRNYGRK